VTSASPESSPGGDRHAGRPGVPVLGLCLLLALIAFAATVHHGVGPPGTGFSQRWYAPTGFFFESEILSAWLSSPRLAFASFGGAGLLLTTGVLLASRSALAAALALASLAAVALFLFYGLIAPGPWRFFGWRGSASLVLVALCFGFSAAAPALARSWLRLAWPLRIAVYLPFAAFVVGFLCNATGTDPQLSFAISPWPVVPVFGLESGALFLAAGWGGTAIAVGGLARNARPGAAALAVAAGIAVPALLLWTGSTLGLFPFQVRPPLLLALALGCGLAIAVAASLRLADRGPALRRRARRLAVGAALIAVPLCAGQAWAFFDYQVTREVRARRIIDALVAWVQREEFYPESLEQLVESGDLEQLPRPAIGIASGGDEGFRYQSFGSSYLLEFTATRWVQCAYTPAPIYGEDEDPEEYADEDLGESWSCPSRPPELW
jgi:hypothetical protein